MKWTDDAIVLNTQPHGEGALIVQLLTHERGRHAGLVRGGQSPRLRALYQAGNCIQATWTGRLAEHLGTYQGELLESHAARLMDEPKQLLALSAATAVIERALPEREPHPACYEGMLVLLDALEGDHWAEVYVSWELAVLADLGFALGLDSCAANPDWQETPNDQLAYVSPKTGRAVSLSAGEPYHERLLVLPGFLLGRGEGGDEEVGQGLALSGHFLERHVFHPQDRQLPDARRRLAEVFITS